ncbi:MAG: 3-dehydroquinate synthase family protein [Acidimicrobiales bacterium]
MITVPVPLVWDPYEVVIGAGARHGLRDKVSALEGVRKIAVVTQANLVDAGWLAEMDLGAPYVLSVIADGEAAKRTSTIERLCSDFAQGELSRNDLVIAVGGGVVTDTAGFAAACYHRGIRYLNVATTLLAQVDAAIGGKTGVDLPEGKNLVGAFHQPGAVLCDTEMLESLPAREWRCGRGEMAKYAFLSGEAPDASLLDLPLDAQVAHCVQIKANVVVSDVREAGERALLNYGHTLAHALETEALASGSDLAHGEAVAVGLMFAALLARRLGRIDDPRVELHRQVLASFGLNAELPGAADPDRLVRAMARDKKAHHDLTFVLDGPRGPEVVRGVPAADVTATLADMGARSER